MEPEELAARHPPTHGYGADDDAMLAWLSGASRSTPYKPLQATFILDIPQGRAWGEYGSVIAPPDTLIEDVSIDLGTALSQTPSRHEALFRGYLGRVRRLRGSIAVIAALGGNNYFHWMLQILPRLDILARGGVSLDDLDGFIVNHLQHGFQRETLEILKIPDKKLIQTSPSLHVRAERLLVPSRPSGMNDVRRSACKFIRNQFGGRGAGKYRVKRIYVSREDATRRKVSNECEVRAHLKPLGFQSLCLTGIPVLEQARWFADAEIVVGAHGAGFANLVFSPKGATLVEFFSPSYINTCYWSLCNAMGHRYFFLLGRGSVPLCSANWETGDDVHVDIEMLKRVFRLL